MQAERIIDNKQSSDICRNRVAAKPGRWRLLAIVIVFGVAGISAFDIGIIYLMVDLIRYFAESIWRLIGAIGFYLYKLYSLLITPDQWRGG